MRRRRREPLPTMIFLILASALLAPTTVLAHNPGGVAGGFASGFMHPLTGIDHILAMVAVGIWALNWVPRQFGHCRSLSRWSCR